MKQWPALDVRSPSDPDRLLAAVDDFAPTAAEERGDLFRVFFPSAAARDGAARVLGVLATPVDVDDEDWARRSQSSLAPITIGRVTIVPDRSTSDSRASGIPVHGVAPDDTSITIVIPPSMGFGTGHHATTRLCLAALQTLDLRGASVLDVGTGSGVLAIASSRLGARCALGLDADRDAIESARDNLVLNPAARNVRLLVADLYDDPLPTADVVLANLTGAQLVRAAARLVAALGPTGVLVVSGILVGEEASVRSAFDGLVLRDRWQEDEWMCFTFNRRVSSSV